MSELINGMNTRKRVVLVCTEEPVQQNFKDDCDINHILKRYQKTGVVTHLNEGTPHYGDFTEVPDFRSALEIVNRSIDAFDSLPSAVRDRFANDPAELLDFIQNPANRDEAVSLGLISKPQGLGAGSAQGDSSAGET